VFSTAIVLLLADGPHRFSGLIRLEKRLQKWAFCLSILKIPKKAKVILMMDALRLIVEG